jgi:hypothetical protein
MFFFAAMTVYIAVIHVDGEVEWHAPNTPKRAVRETKVDVM